MEEVMGPLSFGLGDDVTKGADRLFAGGTMQVV